LTADFNAWAKDDLGRPWPNATLSEKLGGLGLEIRRTKKGKAFAGIRLDQRYEQEPFWDISGAGEVVK
jgi:hypothetical protein